MHASGFSIRSCLADNSDATTSRQRVDAYLLSCLLERLRRGSVPAQPRIMYTAKPDELDSHAFMDTSFRCRYLPSSC